MWSNFFGVLLLIHWTFEAKLGSYDSKYENILFINASMSFKRHPQPPAPWSVKITVAYCVCAPCLHGHWLLYHQQLFLNMSSKSWCNGDDGFELQVFTLLTCPSPILNYGIFPQFGQWGDGTSWNDVSLCKFPGTPGPLEELSQKHNVPALIHPFHFAPT